MHSLLVTCTLDSVAIVPAAAAPVLFSDAVHPQDRTGHWAMADLLVALTQASHHRTSSPAALLEAAAAAGPEGVPCPPAERADHLAQLPGVLLNLLLRCGIGLWNLVVPRLLLAHDGTPSNVCCFAGDGGGACVTAPGCGG